MRALNRILILIIGLAMIIAAAVMLLIGSGLAAGWGSPWLRPIADGAGVRLPGAGDPVMITDGLAQLTGPTVLIILAVAGVVLALIGLAWVIALIPRPTPAPAFRLHADPGSGVITIEPKVLAGAVERQLDRLPGVTAARVTIRGALAQPDVDLSITIDEQADLADLVDRVHSAILPALADALETRLRRVAVVLQIGRRSDSDSEVTIAAGAGS
jgi:hypothetical protein